MKTLVFLFAIFCSSLSSFADEREEFYFEARLVDGLLLDEAMTLVRNDEGWSLPGRRLGDALGLNVIEKMDIEPAFELEEEKFFSKKSLEENFQLEIKVDELRSTIFIKSHNTLPIQERIARSQQIIGGHRSGLVEDGSLRVENRSQGLSLGQWDQRITFEERGSPESKNDSLLYNTTLTGGVSSYDALMYFNGKNDEILNETFTLTKKSDRGLYNFSSLKEVQFFDFAAPSSRLIGGGGFLTGAYLSSYDFNVPDSYGSKTFTGILRPDWEVELYHNDILIGRQFEEGEGEYSFRNIILYYGLNRFKFIFYGPRGEVIEKTESYLINAKMFNNDAPQFQLYAGEDGKGNISYGASSRISFLKGISTEAAIKSVHLDAENRLAHYGKFGITGFINKMLLGADYVKDFDRGDALLLTSNFLVSKLNFRFESVFLNDFSSNEYEKGPGENRLEKSALGEVRFRGSVAMPISHTLSGSVENFENGLEKGLYKYAATFSTRYLDLLGSLEYEKYDQELFESERWHQEVGVRVKLGALLLTSEISSNSEEGPYSSRYTARKNITDKYSFKASLLNDHIASSKTYELSLGKTFQWLSANISGTHTPESESYSIRAGLDFNVFADKANREVRMGHRHKAKRGACLIRVFVDENRDGKWQKNERTLSDIETRIVELNKKGKTNEEGLVYFDDLPAYRLIKAQVNPAMVPDPDLSPSIVGARFWSRPGVSAIIDYPIGVFGEIEGNVFISRANEKVGAKNVSLFLYDDQDQIISKTMTDEEGFYFFEGVPPGKYQVKVKRDQKKEYAMSFFSEEIILNPEELLVDQVNFNFISFE